MATPEEIGTLDTRQLEAPYDLDITVDPLLVAANAVAKLKAAGLSGYVDFRISDKAEPVPDNVTPFRPPEYQTAPSPYERAIAEDEVKRHDHQAAFVGEIDKGERVEDNFASEYLEAKTARENETAFNKLFEQWKGFLRLKASNYFLAGGDNQDLMQEAAIGFYKAVRDYDGRSPFRTFLDLCVTRQLITAIKTATRFKHAPLNTFVSFSHTPPGSVEGDTTLGDSLPGPVAMEPPSVVISSDELQSLVFSLGTGLSAFESDTLRLFLEGSDYAEMARELDCDTKAIDNALQRVKRKILAHQKTREALL